MILFIGLWHLVSVLGISLAFAAFVGVSALLWFLWDIWQQIEDEKSGAEQQKRDRKSQSAVKGWQTRKANAPAPLPLRAEDVRALLGAQDIGPTQEPDKITPDDAFVQRGEDQ